MIQIRPDLQLIFEKEPSREIRGTLDQKINEFNARTVPYEQERFAVLLRDSDNRLMGGLSAILYWDWLFVDDLWIDDTLRGQGLGRELMARAETYASDRGCHSAWVDTFQAHRFYENLGYEIFGELANYPVNQRRRFLSKRLDKGVMNVSPLNGMNGPARTPSAPILRGVNVILRRPRAEDIAERVALGRDTEIVRMFGGDTSRSVQPLTTAEASQWLGQLSAHPHAWVVENEGKFLGEARLDGLGAHDARARLAIGFYDPARLGRGLGREVVHLLLRHAFEDLRQHRVDLRVVAYNERAIRCYRSCGFIEDGREREAALVDGKRYDDVIMSILAAEYERTKGPAHSTKVARATAPLALDLPSSIETERLTIRCPRPGDGEKVFEAVKDSLDNLRRFPASFSWLRQDPSPATQEEYCRKSFADFMRRDNFPMIMLLRGTDTVIGSSGLHRVDWSVPKCEVGWWGRTSYLGQGLITEGVGAIVEFAFSTLGARRVEAFPDDLNDASCRMCERLGLKLEGILRNERVDPGGTLRNTRIYAKTRS